MKYDHFKMSIAILLIGSIITKIGSLIIKILFTRIIGETGLSYYTMITPAANLFITLSTLSIPLTLSKIIGENKYPHREILISTAITLIAIQIILSITYFLFIPFLASNLLHNQKLSIILYCLVLTLPFLSISAILKGYYLGRQKVIPNIISNIIEQTIRILFLIFILPLLTSINIWLALTSYILLSIVTELASIIVFSIFMPPHKKIKKNELIINKSIFKEVLSMSIPITSSHIIGSIAFFLEPIIITNILLHKEFTITYISSEYAIYNAYVIPMLTLPAFFINAMCQIFIPEISQNNKNNNYHTLKKRIKEAIIYSFFIGLCYLLILTFQKEFLLKLLYNTEKGLPYLNILIPFFLLFYLEYPLHSIIEALGHPKKIFYISLIGIIVKIIVLIILLLKKIGMYALVYAEIANIILVVFLLSFHLAHLYRSF